MDSKKHYYLVGYAYEFKSGNFGVGSLVVTQPQQGEFTKQYDLDYLSEITKASAQKNSDSRITKSFITSISYLGYMNNEEFNQPPTE